MTLTFKAGSEGWGQPQENLRGCSLALGPPLSGVPLIQTVLLPLGSGGAGAQLGRRRGLTADPIPGTRPPS